MTDTDREARLEEIRERVEAHERGVKGAAHDDEASDLRFLLAEIDRLREIEEAARECRDRLREIRSTLLYPYRQVVDAAQDRLRRALHEGDEDG